MSGRFDTLFSHDAPSLLVFAEAAAARLAGVTFAEMTSSGGSWTKHAISTSRLVGSHALILGFCKAFAAEAAGARVSWAAATPFIEAASSTSPPAFAAASRWKALIDALTVTATDAGAPPVIACLPGPAELCGLVSGRADDFLLGQFKEVMVELAEQVCRCRPDAVLLRESTYLQSCTTAAYRKAYATVKNVARYYDVPLVFAFDSITHAPSDLLPRLKPDAVLFLADAGALPDIPATKAIANDAGAVGVAMNIGDVDVTRERLAACRSQLQGIRWFGHSAAEISAQADLAPIRETGALFARKS